jgi:hypothetical protein
VNAVLREITNMPSIRDKSVVRSSTRPSAKYRCSSERNGQRLLQGLAFYVIQGKVAVGGED